MSIPFLHNFTISTYLNSQRLKNKVFIKVCTKLLREVKRVGNIERTYNIRYPECIRELRQDRDLTQREIARILKVAQTTYSQYELYKRPMPIECLMTLCKFYDVSADYILGFTDER